MFSYSVGWYENIWFIFDYSLSLYRAVIRPCRNWDCGKSGTFTLFLKKAFNSYSWLMLIGHFGYNYLNSKFTICFSTNFCNCSEREWLPVLSWYCTNYKLAHTTCFFWFNAVHWHKVNLIVQFTSPCIELFIYILAV